MPGPSRGYSNSPISVLICPFDEPLRSPRSMFTNAVRSESPLMRCPLRADLIAGNAPHLFGVALEKDIEQTAPEPVGNPVFEADFRTGRRRLGPEIAGQ